MLSRFDNVHGSDAYGNPVDELPEDALESIRRNGVGCLHPSHLLHSRGPCNEFSQKLTHHSVMHSPCSGRQIFGLT